MPVYESHVEQHLKNINNANITQESVDALYEEHLRCYEQIEDKAINAMFKQDASKGIEDYNFLTKEEEKQIDDAIKIIEDSIKNLYINNQKIPESPSQYIAKNFLMANQALQGLNADNIRVLQQIINGRPFSEIIIEDDLEKIEVANVDDVTIWINKIFKTLEEVKKIDKDTPTLFTGYLSNLKGAWLENAALEFFKNNIISGVAVRTGNVNVEGRGQIAEDIVLLFGDKQQTLAEYLEESQEKRTTISVPLYDELKENSIGVTVKAGKGKIKYFQGQLNPFFEIGETFARDYRFYLMDQMQNSSMIKESSDYKNADKSIQRKMLKPFRVSTAGKLGIINRYLVANKLPSAIGVNNGFAVIRGKVYRMSDLLRKKVGNYRKQLSMSYERVDQSSVIGRIMGSGM